MLAASEVDTMAKTRSRINTLYVGLTNPPTTKVLSKKDLKVDGPKQVRDDTTTDDSAGPEHAVIFAGDIAGVDFTVLMDSADTSYLLLRDAECASTPAAAPSGADRGRRVVPWPPSQPTRRMPN